MKKKQKQKNSGKNSFFTEDEQKQNLWMVFFCGILSIKGRTVEEKMNNIINGANCYNNSIWFVFITKDRDCFSLCVSFMKSKREKRHMQASAKRTMSKIMS